MWPGLPKRAGLEGPRDRVSATAGTPAVEFGGSLIESATKNRYRESVGCRNAENPRRVIRKCSPKGPPRLSASHESHEGSAVNEPATADAYRCFAPTTTEAMTHSSLARLRRVWRVLFTSRHNSPHRDLLFAHVCSRPFAGFEVRPPTRRSSARSRKPRFERKRLGVGPPTSE